MPMPTLMEIAIQNGCDSFVGLIDETITAHPEVNLGAARTIKSTQYKTLVRTGLPIVPMRNANEGQAPTKSTFENRMVETYILNPRWEVDIAVADAHEDGAAASIALEASGHVEGSLVTLSKMFYYGRTANGDLKGCPGLLDSLDTDNMVVDAGGTTADTASSVWGVRFGPKEVQWVWGMDGQLEPGEVTLQRVTDANGNPFDAYCQNILAYPGLQVGSRQSLCRIKKITEDSSKTLDDDMIAAMLALCPVGKEPHLLLMTRRSQEQLRASRTATNPTGAPAPLPESAFKIPIEVTDSILNTESLTL